jgi:hypothetical protein
MTQDYSTNATQIPSSALEDAKSFIIWVVSDRLDTLLAASVISDCWAVAGFSGVPSAVVDACRRLPRTPSGSASMTRQGIDIEARILAVAVGLATNAVAAIQTIRLVRSADLGTLRL